MNVFHILNSPQCCSNEALTITSNGMSAEFEHPWDTCTGLADPSDAPHEVPRAVLPARRSAAPRQKDRVERLSVPVSVCVCAGPGATTRECHTPGGFHNEHEFSDRSGG